MVVYFLYIVKSFKHFSIGFTYSKEGLVLNQAFLTLLKSLLLVILLAGCSPEKKKKLFEAIDTSIYSTKNFSDLKLDSTAITTFFKTFPASDSIKNEVNQFYNRREFQYAWFNKKGISDAASTFYTQIKNYSHDFEDKQFDNARFETLMSAVESDEKKFLSIRNDIQELELILTTTFFQYSHKVYGGIDQNPHDLEWFIPRKKKDYQILLDSLVSNTNHEKIQEPVNQYYISLKEKLRQYRAIQKKGGFFPVITDKKLLEIGDSDTCLIVVKHHLLLTNDLKTNDNSIFFTDSLSFALKNFQHRMGLVENGKIDHATIMELNKPIELRIKQMMVNMERLRWVPVEVEKDYLLVNIPEFRLHVFENGKLAWATNVVVGKAAKRTSIFKGNISQIVLNPYWGIPKSIVQNEILPKIKRNPNYLAQNNMEIINGNYRQKPGKNNALGKIKFLFPNNFSIYLHDTPSKSLFKETERAFSHGCIRVAEPKKLALYLLKMYPEWNEKIIDNILLTDREHIIKIKPTFPVYIAYFTAWVDSKGQMNFRNDIYDLDKKLAKEIFGE